MLPPDSNERASPASEPEATVEAGTPGRDLEPTDEQVGRILREVRAGSGVDLTQYRDSMVKRRIARRAMLRSMTSIDEYVALLHTDRDEVDDLYQDMLINVTAFFRDAELFESLKRHVFPSILSERRQDEAVRLWVAGCSTGQEVYSLLIALMEFLDGASVRPPIQVFATDLDDEAALGVARAGMYPESIESEVDSERLRRFFRKVGSHYVVDRALRDLCVFAPHNVAADPPFSHIDLVSCRNVLIYMSAPLQRRVLNTLHYALRTRGYLVLGASESVGSLEEGYTAVDRSMKIFARKAIDRHPFATAFADTHSYSSIVARLQARVPAPLEVPTREAILTKASDERRMPKGEQALRRELNALQEQVHALIQQRHAMAEELRSANEEVLASNEELQSTNEELQSAKEELQASNEELRTVNEQLQARNLQLVQANSDLANLFSSVGIPVVMVGRDLGIRRFTPAAVRFLQLGPQDVGRSIGALSTKLEMPGLEALVSEVIAYGETRDEEVHHSSGRSLAIRVDPYRATNDDIEGAIVVVVDITTVRRGEDAQVHLAAIVESSEDSIVSKTLDGIITSWNRGAQRLYGYTAAEVVGRPISILIPPGRPDELPSIMERLARGERIEHYETIRRRKDGTLLDVSVSISPVRNIRGDIVGAAAITRDISTTKAAEALLRFQIEAGNALASLDTREAVLEKVGALVVPFLADGCLVDMVEPNGTLRRVSIAHVNPSKIALLSELEVRYPISERADRGPLHVLRSGQAEMLSDVPQSLLEAAAQDDDHRRMLLEIGPRSYVSVPIRIRDYMIGVLTLFSSESGRRYTTNDVRIAEDLASRAAIAFDNAGLYSALREADRRKDEFLAILAHELRNPLAPIRSAVEIMRLKNNEDPDLTTVRDIIDRQTYQMTRIVDDLLDISRITHGRIELQKRRVSLANVIESAVESSRPLITERRHELAVSVPAEPVWIEVDPTRLAQAVLNLLNNAAKFTPPGGKIWLNAVRAAEGNPATEQIVITVRDTGIGVPENMRERIFELFTQGERSTEPVQGGLGVGLMLVRSLVEMHGGTIDVHSAGQGMGSEFTVRLPVSRQRRDHDESPVGENATATRRKILIVDDNRDQAHTLATMLQLWGHEVRVTHDGRLAVSEAATFMPDVALVDLGLPELDGYEVARMIRARPDLARTVLIAVSGWGQDEHRQRSAAAGFLRHLVKPVAPETLREVLAESGIGNRESGIGSRESGVGNRESGIVDRE